MLNAVYFLFLGVLCYERVEWVGYCDFSVSGVRVAVECLFRHADVECWWDSCIVAALFGRREDFE